MSEYTQSELPAIELFAKLGYDYFDAIGRGTETSVSEMVRLKSNLRS